MSDPKPNRQAQPIQAEEVVTALRGIVRQLERTPSPVETGGEEDIRDVLLAGLNGSFPGQASSETFNRRGKTDILVRDGDRNVYLAECKVYSGPDGIGSAIAQLLSYTSWLDRSLGLIVFVRHTTMSTATKSARASIEKHEATLSVRSIDSEGTELEATLMHPEDQAVHIALSVMLVSLPKRGKFTELLDLADAVATGADENFEYHLGVSGGRTPPPDLDRSMFRIEQQMGGGRIVVDAVPRDDEVAALYGPSGVVQVESDTEIEALRRLVKDSIAVRLPRARVSFDRVPPLLADAVENIIGLDAPTAEVTLNPGGLWQCLLRVKTDRGEVEAPMAFAYSETGTGARRMRGTFYNARLTLEWEDSGTVELRWEYDHSGGPSRERAASLELLHALSGKGEVKIAGRNGDVAPLRVELARTELPPELTALHALLYPLNLVEDYLEVDLTLPLAGLRWRDIEEIVAAASAIQSGVAKVKVKEVEIITGADFALPAGFISEVGGPIPVTVPLLGKKFDLGVGWGDFVGKVVHFERAGNTSRITVVPRDDQAATVEVSGFLKSSTAVE